MIHLPTARRDSRTRRDTRCPESETRIEIRFADIDMMQVVHHAAYLHWFEKIRFNALGRIFGLDFDRLHREGVALPLISCSVEYLKPFRFGDAPIGYAEFEVHKKALFSVTYGLYRGETDELCATGRTTHCFLSKSGLMPWAPLMFRDACVRAAKTHSRWVRQMDPLPDRPLEPLMDPAMIPAGGAEVDG